MNPALIGQLLTDYLIGKKAPARLRIQNRAGVAGTTRPVNGLLVAQAQPEAGTRRPAPHSKWSGRIETAFWWTCCSCVIAMIFFALLDLV